jgi:hypothetical protein
MKSCGNVTKPFLKASRDKLERLYLAGNRKMFNRVKKIEDSEDKRTNLFCDERSFKQLTIADNVLKLFFSSFRKIPIS